MYNFLASFVHSKKISALFTGHCWWSDS